MSKLTSGRQLATAKAFMSTGNQARELRAQLAQSFLGCETIVQEMRAIRANLTLPAEPQAQLPPAVEGEDDDVTV